MCSCPTRRQRKKRRILRQIRALPTTTALLAEDETDLLLFPPLRAGWARRGQPAPVLISGSNARRTVFGALHLRTGRLLCLEQARKRASEFQEFLDFLRWHYRRWPVALLLDENSSHTDEASQSLADDLDIHLLWLPKRSPHLNPLEHLWGYGKAEVCANLQQSSMEDQVAYFIHYYQTLSRTEILRKAGLHSPKFWLYEVGH
jgi:DDE superfamily endonuclease